MGEASGGGGGGFDAFISYSHADAAVATWLHRAVEGYRVPAALVGSDGAHGPVPARVGRIFRDEEELGAASDLSPAIEAAIAGSRALIVVCSPRAAASQWVAREIVTFKQVNPDRPVLALIVDGVPGDLARECFPDPLKYRVAADGAIDRTVVQEPLAPDLQKMDRDVARLKLLSGLIGVPFDALVSRERRRARRRIAFAGAAAAAVIAVLASMVVITLQANEEQRAARLAETQQRARAEESARVATEQRAAALRSRDIAEQQRKRAEAATRRAEAESARAIASAAEARRQQGLAEAATAEALGRQAETLSTQALAALARGDSVEARTLVDQLRTLPAAAGRRPLSVLAQQRLAALPNTVSSLPGDAAAIDFVPSTDGRVLILDDRQSIHWAESRGMWQTMAAPAAPFLVDGDLAYARTGEKWRVDNPAASLARWSPTGVVAAAAGRTTALMLTAISADRQLVEYVEGGEARVRTLAFDTTDEDYFAPVDIFRAAGGETAIMRADGRLFLVAADGAAIDAAALFDPRYAACTDGLTAAGLVCQNNAGPIELVGWDGKSTPLSSAAFGAVRVMLPGAGGVAIQRENGGVALVVPDDAGLAAADFAEGIVPIELGVWGDELVAVEQPDPTAAILLFASGRIVARDIDSGTTYFDIRLPQGIKTARLDPARRQLTALTMAGQVHRVDLDALWYRDWVESTGAPNVGAPASAARAAPPGEALRVVRFAAAPVPAEAPYELVWADGASGWRIERFGEQTLLIGSGGAWLLPGNPQRARIASTDDQPLLMLFTDREALVFDRREAGTIMAKGAAIDGLGASTALAGPAGDDSFLIIGRRGSLLLMGDRAVRIADPWPFASEPERFAIDRRFGLLVIIDRAGRSQVSHLASGSEILRAFGGPAAADSIWFERGHAVARGAKAESRAIRLPLLEAP